MIKYRLREYSVIFEENTGNRFFYIVTAKTARQAMAQAYHEIMSNKFNIVSAYSIRPIKATWLDRPERKPKSSKNCQLKNS